MAAAILGSWLPDEGRKNRMRSESLISCRGSVAPVLLATKCRASVPRVTYSPLASREEQTPPGAPNFLSQVSDCPAFSPAGAAQYGKVSAQKSLHVQLNRDFVVLAEVAKTLSRRRLSRFQP